MQKTILTNADIRNLNAPLLYMNCHKGKVNLCFYLGRFYWRHKWTSVSVDLNRAIKERICLSC